MHEFVGLGVQSTSAEMAIHLVLDLELWSKLVCKNVSQAHSDIILPAPPTLQAGLTLVTTMSQGHLAPLYVFVNQKASTPESNITTCVHLNCFIANLDTFKADS